MSKEVKFRLEATLYEIDGKITGGITIGLKGTDVDIAHVLFSAMIQDDKVQALIMAAVERYNLGQLSGNKGQAVNTCPAFLAVMRNDDAYCRAITEAVVVFWSGAGVDLGQLPQLVKMG